MSDQDASSKPATEIPKVGQTRNILLGLLAGILWGLVLGDQGEWIKWLGDVYIGLLQMSVLPFISASLIVSIGRLSYGQSKQLGLRALTLQVVLWVLGLLILMAMSLAFPQFKGGSFFSTSLVETPESKNWIDLFVPANPFWSLANNMVPAVVFFSLGLGGALMGVPNKELLLDKMDVLLKGLSRLNGMVLKLAPVGIFGVVAYAACILSVEQFGLLQGYLLVYGAATLIVSLWVFPMLISCCTGLPYWKILSHSRDAMLTAFVIGNTFVVLPLLIDAVQRLTKECDTKDPAASEYLVPLGYPFPDVGRIIGLVFIPFAAWFYGSQIASENYPQLVAVGFAGSFAKPVATIPLLLDLAKLPDDIFNLYLSIGVFSSRFGDLMKTMHLLTFSVLIAYAFTHTVQINVKRLISSSLITLILTIGIVVGIRSVLNVSFTNNYSKKQLVTAAELVLPKADAIILDAAKPNEEPLRPGEDNMQRIQRQGRIRIGFHPDNSPFSYFNSNGDLVGLDVDLAHQLARDLGVNIEFVPCEGDVIRSLWEDEFDVAMSGYEGTLKRSANLPHITPYMEVTAALVVKDYLRGKFKREEPLRNDPNLKFAVVQRSAASELPKQFKTRAEIVVIPNERAFFESDPPLADGLVTSAEAGSAWTLQYPEFDVVIPKHLNVTVPLYHYVTSEGQFEEFIEGWQALKRRDGTIDKLKDYWIFGKQSRPEKPRWCVIRDVLQWVK